MFLVEEKYYHLASKMSMITRAFWSAESFNSCYWFFTYRMMTSSKTWKILSCWKGVLDLSKAEFFQKIIFGYLEYVVFLLPEISCFGKNFKWMREIANVPVLDCSSALLSIVTEFSPRVARVSLLTRTLIWSILMITPIVSCKLQLLILCHEGI